MKITVCRVLMFTAAMTMARTGTAAENTGFHDTECEGRYPGHLQGVCTDGTAAIFWSWTTALVKTDPNGKVLRQASVPSHHGDLCHHAGRIYVAVNLGRFNEPAGHADSWVYVYDAATLAELARHAVPEVVHGAGGIAFHQGKFIVVGGLPPGTEENYAYEYDGEFRFQRRHVLASGYTYKGIQTAAWAEGAWWFATYGDTRYLLRADGNFQLTGKWVFDASLGLAPIGGGRFLIGRNQKDAEGKHRGRVTVFRVDAKAGLHPEN